MIALFSMLFLLGGVMIGALFGRFHREPTYATSVRVSRAVTGAILAVCALGAVGNVSSMVEMIDDEGTCFSAAGGGNGCAVRTKDLAP